MRALTTISFFILFISCNNSNIHDEPAIKVESKIVIVSTKFDTTLACIPTYYDTSFNWVDTSNCRYSWELKFRFQPKKLTAYKENCLFNSFPPTSQDTVDRITLIYSKSPINNLISSSDSLAFYNYHLKRKEESFTSAMGFDLPFDTVETVNGHLYSIILITHSQLKTTNVSKKVHATTIVKGTLVSFTYEIIRSKQDLSNKIFLSNSKYFLSRSNPGNGM
jgi:hypothetical protein